MNHYRAVLIGHNYTSILGLARVLGPAGYDVFVIRTGISMSKNLFRNLGNMPESKSKYVVRYVAVNGDQTENQIIDILLNQFAQKNNKGILFPVDDVCSEILDRNYDRLSLFYHLPNVNDRQGGVLELMDKFYQKKLAKEAGLSVPDGWSVKIENGEFAIPEEVTYPCFIKAEMPMEKRKHFMCRCDNKQQLMDALNKAAAYRDCIMLIDEYVDIEKEYGAVGMCYKNNVCIPGIIEKRVSGHGSQAGVNVIGKYCLSKKHESLIRQLKSMMLLSGFQGLFDIDLFESKGTIYFCELNVRIGGSGPAAFLAGVDLPKMLADSFINPNKLIDFEADAKEFLFINERPLLSEYREGFITLREFSGYIKRIKHRFIYDPRDILPCCCFSITVIMEILRKIKRKLKPVH